MQHRYRALRTIAVIYKILGVLVGIITVIAALLVCGSAFLGGAALSRSGLDTSGLGPGFGIAGGLAAGVFALIYGLLIALFLYAFGEGIYLLLALEENTRLTTTLLQQSIRNTAAALPPAQPAATSLVPTQPPP